MAKLGDNLKELREGRGWSQKYVAERMKIKQSSTYANWEYGIRDPDTETLSRLADLYEVTTDYLLGREPKNSLNDKEIYEIAKTIKGIADPIQKKLTMDLIKSMQSANEQIP